MTTLTVVLTMVAVMVVLLAAAIVADRLLQRRMARRRALEENPEASAAKRDAADALIDILNRSRGMVRQAMKATREDEE